jgi:hypothetical protein
VNRTALPDQAYREPSRARERAPASVKPQRSKVDVLSTSRSNVTVDPAREAVTAESAVCSESCSKLIDIVRLLARQAAREWSTR